MTKQFTEKVIPFEELGRRRELRNLALAKRYGLESPDLTIEFLYEVSQWGRTKHLLSPEERDLQGKRYRERAKRFARLF